jgi:uncharacterized protein (DUF2461 family)
MGKKMETPGFALQITPQDVGSMAGMFTFPKPLLEAYRRAVVDEEQGEALETAVMFVQRAGDYQISGEDYKRVPNGFDANHPRARWLKFSSLHVFAPTIGLDVAQTPALVDVLFGHFINMSPIHQWLMAAVINQL